MTAAPAVAVLVIATLLAVVILWRVIVGMLALTIFALVACAVYEVVQRLHGA